MTRSRIDRLRIRVRAPLDQAGARALAAAIARELPSAIGEARGGDEVPRVVVPAVRVAVGELSPARQPALARRVAHEVGRSLDGKERP